MPWLAIMTELKNICYIISGDQWAGAEAQAFLLIKEIANLLKVRIQVILFNDGLLAKRLQELNVKIDIVDEKRNILSVVKQVIKILKIYKYDVVHVHGYKENFIGGIAARLCGIRNVVRTHHGIAMVGKGTVKNQLIEVINKKYLTAKIIAVSVDLKNYLIKNSFNVQEISVIHNGINTAVESTSGLESAMDRDENSRSGKIHIGTAGRLVPVKGHIYLIEGIRRVVEVNNNIFVSIIGEGPLQNELKNRVEKFGLNQYISFLGFCKNIEKYINGLDIFILPSLHEGMPMVLLEAMKLGKAIIASEVGGIPEAIQNNFNGLLIPAHDAEAISNACLDLIRDGSIRNKLGQNARITVREKFSLSRTVEKTIECYTKG
jgi:glycosyltransferase involved in cell wall biosynthesis